MSITFPHTFESVLLIGDAEISYEVDAEIEVDIDPADPAVGIFNESVEISEIKIKGVDEDNCRHIFDALTGDEILTLVEAFYDWAKTQEEC